MEKRFEFLEHTADVKFQAFGKTLEQVFENSALAMFNTMHEGIIQEKKKAKISAKGKDFENLLYNFLEELLVLFDGQHFFLAKIENIKIDQEKMILQAEVSGDSAEDYEMTTDIKAVTYNDMFIKKEKDGWIAQVVLDV